MDDDTRLTTAERSMALMSRAFRDLAAASATVNAGAADRAIHGIETLVAAEMTKFCDEPPEGIAADQAAASVIPVVRLFRDMTQGARQFIQQAAKPN